SILDCINSGFILMDPETHRIVDVNTYALGMIGATRDQVINRVCHQFVCPAEIGKCPVTDLGQTVNVSERILINAQGARIPILKSVTQVELQNRTFLLESFIDITERKQAEKKIRDTKDSLENIFKVSPDIIMITDAEGTITSVNGAVETILGYSPEELIGIQSTILAPVEEHYKKNAREMIYALFEKGFIINHEFYWRKKHGGVCPFECSSILLKNDEGNKLHRPHYYG
ncbi:MAG: PAS domain-containing protein, partial [Proteobacteria bacterium]|nr:PAS domain-containing protein [Pseudomonadota bacterium]